MNGNSPFVSVIMPVRNGEDYLLSSLPAVRRSDHDDFELIVVDDNSTDSSADISKRFADLVITQDERRGPARARNTGAERSRGSILLFIDADVEIRKDTICLVVREMTGKPELDAVFGSYDSEPMARNVISQYKNLLHHFVHQNSSPRASTFWAGCGAIRREIFFELGGFPGNGLSPSIEDVRLGYKLTERMGEIRLLKDLQVKHLKKWSFVDLLKTDIFGRAIPWSRLTRGKHLPYDLNFKCSDRISGVVTCLLFLTFCIVWRLPVASFLILVFSAVLIFLNRVLYGFFWRRRGPGFTAVAIGLHWLYFLYSSAAFGISSISFVPNLPFRRKRCQ